MIIEKASGIPYATFLQKNVFDPLRLANTGSTCNDLPPGPNAARGNVPGAEAGSLVPLPFEEAAVVGPGSLYSRAHDLYAWLKAVDANRSDIFEFYLRHSRIMVLCREVSEIPS